jgi:hypothetical protein
MLKFGWGPKIKSRKFEYIPRYYDPEKEAFEERLQMLQEKYGDRADLNVEKMKMRIKQGLRAKSNADPTTRIQAEKAAAFKRMIIIAVLVVLVIMILQSDKIEKILHLIYK